MNRWILVCFLVAFEIVTGALLADPLLAEDAAAPTDARPTPVTRQEVWLAVLAELHQRGLAESQLPRIEDLDLPLALPALAGRRLRVASACWDEGPERTQFRLECGEPGKCLPFLVYIRGDLRGDVHGSPGADAVARAGSCRLDAESHPSLGSRLAAEAAPKPTVRAGDRATAVFVSDRLRITASVTCLERGREGEVIRVRNQDGEVFRARISGPALLETVPQ